MTVFQLMVYSCVTFSGFGMNGTWSKSCEWRTWGPLRTTLEGCESDAKKTIGAPIYSDVMDGRAIEQARCDAVQVAE